MPAALFHKEPALAESLQLFLADGAAADTEVYEISRLTNPPTHVLVRLFAAERLVAQSAVLVMSVVHFGLSDHLAILYMMSLMYANCCTSRWQSMHARSPRFLPQALSIR